MMDNMRLQTYKVMYEPATYLHISRSFGSYEQHSTAIRRIYNQFIIERFQLPISIDFPVAENTLANVIIRHWDILPKATWYIGCYFYSQALVLTGRLDALPSGLKAFLTLSALYPNTTPCSLTLLDDAGLTRVGIASIDHILTQYAPALAPRFRLLFPEDACIKTDIPIFDLSPSLLKMVFNYATLPA